MPTFYNQASLSLGGQITNSNTTEAELLSGLTLTKTAITASYGAGDGVVYAVTLTNAGGSVYTNLTVTDDLGAYTLPDGTTTVVPLTYADGSIRLYLNGILQTPPTVTVVDGQLTVTGIDLPANGTATLLYEATANGFAPLAAGSTITNTASVLGGAGIGTLTAEATVTADEAPQLTIAKAVCPAIVTDNEELTYTLIVQNLGNTPINATDGLTVSDTFSPILSNITVTLDGAPLAEGTGYTYDDTTGAFTTLDGAVTVPAATYTQDPVTGAIVTTPGVAVLTITGTV
ncbi:MAG: DUF11 domain-containing protein [Clostridia bacterium]|nr:DUF11 domain-containing protein [Clostridia bacterium]